MKTVSTTARADDYASTEAWIDEMTHQARRALIDAGKSVLRIYRPRDPREVRAFRRYSRLTHDGFQRYRKTLPWYRRAFLLYKAPNPSAQLAKTRFYAILAGSLITVPINSFLDRNHIAPPMPSISPEHLKYLLSHRAMALSFAVLWALSLLAVVALWVALIMWMRNRVIRFENDRRYYLRDQFDLEQQS